jgi:hypothetical protein
VAAAVRDDRAVGLADQSLVLEDAVVRVELTALAEGRRVQTVLGPGQLHAVADPERAARTLGHACTSRAR